jgi:hypothetical protein
MKLARTFAPISSSSRLRLDGARPSQAWKPGRGLEEPEQRAYLVFDHQGMFLASAGGCQEYWFADQSGRLAQVEKCWKSPVYHPL